MIRSMTGFGDARCNEEGVTYVLEMRSVNNRYFKSNIKVPDIAQHVEPQIEKILRSRIARGSVSLTLRIKNESVTAAYVVNHQALSSYLHDLQKAELPAGVSATVDLATLVTLPGICQFPDVTDDQRVQVTRIVCDIVDRALEDMANMRAREGQVLYEDLLENCRLMGDLIEKVHARAAVVVEEYHDRLSNRVEELLSKARLDLDRDTLCREVALFAERSDVSEEVVRLRAHIDHFVELCGSPEAVGRKLDFLAQEMLREANTIGSKSNNADIARSVVDMKSLIDRIKEQVQNVE